ncbi:MAG: hypothetical protein ACOX8Q_02340 [Christensenellales bacterium]
MAFKADDRFVCVPELMGEFFNHLFLMRFFHIPQPERNAIQTVRIRHIKNIPKRCSSRVVVQKRNALRATVHPAAHMLVPKLYGSAGGGVRTLRIDKELFFERIFIQSGGGF